MLSLRPSSDRLLVRPVIACLVLVYRTGLGRSEYAETDPLLMTLPTWGDCSGMIWTAARTHKKDPVRLIETTLIHVLTGISSIVLEKLLTPALLKSASTLHRAKAAVKNELSTESGSGLHRTFESMRSYVRQRSFLRHHPPAN